MFSFSSVIHVFFIIGVVLFISILLSYCYPSMFMSLSVSSLSILYYLTLWCFYASFFPFCIFYDIMLDVHLPMHLCFIHVNTGYSYCGIVFILICCLLTRLVYWNSQKITKKESPLQVQSRFFRLWYEWNNSRVYIFLYTHACVIFCVLNMCDMF